MKKSVKAIVSGTVQGVFFRKFVKDSADKYFLKGHVRNLENKDVEIVVEGEGENIKKFLEEIRKGPPHAQIRNVNVEERNYSGDFEDFRVIRF